MSLYSAPLPVKIDREYQPHYYRGMYTALETRSGKRRLTASFVIPGILLLISLFSSCGSGGGGEILEAEKLFDLPVGILEDEVDIFHRGNTLPNRKNSLYMYQGLIFIGNSLGSKVMEFSSYGDLISLIYNENENPRPVLLSSRQDEQMVVNRSATAFPFRDIGNIAVTEDHVLLVEDHVAPERRLLDQETGTALQHVIHRFGPSGNYLDYIGQEGVGGTPFPFIVSMNLTARDDLVVTTRSLNAYEIFWYNRDGDILYTLRIDEDHLPAGDQGTFPSLETIYPDMEAYRLYLHVNFEQENGENVTSAVYTLDLPESVYSGSFELPENLQPLPGQEGLEYIQYLFEFIGTAAEGHLFFISRNNSFEHTLIIMDNEGRLVARRILRIENPDIFFNDYTVSQEGIITALLGDPGGVALYWWRADELLP